MAETTNPTYKPFTDDLQAIVDQLEPLFSYDDQVEDLSEDQIAFEELKRLAGLQLRHLHSGQAIMRQIDSAIRSWRRTAQFGGASVLQAAHYEDALQQIRLAIFGETLPTDDGLSYFSKDPTLTREEDFNKKFGSELETIAPEEAAQLKRGFEAAWATPEKIERKSENTISIDGVLYRKATDAEIKKYSFR